MDRQTSQRAHSLKASSTRVTRSVARNTAATRDTSVNLETSTQTPIPAVTTRRKRKASIQGTAGDTSAPSTRQSTSKRLKLSSGDPPDVYQSRRRSRKTVEMSDTGESKPETEDLKPATSRPASSSGAKKKSSKKGVPDSTTAIASPSSSTTPAAKLAKASNKSRPKSSRHSSTKGAISPSGPPQDDSADTDDDDDDNDAAGDKSREAHDAVPNDDEESGRHWSKSGSSRLEAVMQRIHGAISRTMTDLRSILDNLKQREDPTLQRLALEELAQLLLMANEDTLAGHFSPDPYVREIVPLMQANDLGEENPETMLMACRCLANMIEALPSSTASIVYGGAVPVLCEKLLEIHYIDLAEQALTTLEKISVEFPAAIVREGGLTACLTYLDFFATSTQRTAVTTAANCCRNIQQDSFATVRDVMPTLLQVLSSSDPKVLEQGCLCVSRIVESFKYQDARLEELMSEDFLKAIVALLVPGTTNLIGPKIHTSFLRVLAFTARASPKRSVALIKMNVVDTLFQILTGISAPAGFDMTGKIDKVMIMQALIHRPRDQIFETLNVICELLPSVSTDGLHYLQGMIDAGFPGSELVSISQQARQENEPSRAELLADCQEQLRRFTIILLPTLTDAYASTVNLSVRQKVLTAQLKMLSNIDVAILEEALRNVTYSSFLGTILAQEEESSLATYALQAAEVLLKRMDHIYRYQFYREGVFAAIGTLALEKQTDVTASKTPITDNENPAASEVTSAVAPSATTEAPQASKTMTGAQDTIGDMEMDFRDGDTDSDEDNNEDEDENEEDDEDEEEDEDDEDEDEDNGQDDQAGDDHDDDMDEEQESDDTDSDENSDDYVAHAPPSASNGKDQITVRAKKFMELYDHDVSSSLRAKASRILDELQTLNHKIIETFASKNKTEGVRLFKVLATYFSQDPSSSVTSYELLNSNVVETLLEVVSEAHSHRVDARSAFLQAFMDDNAHTSSTSTALGVSSTPFNVLVSKLQDLLSREEHFEVITAYQNSGENGRSHSATILAKQVRLKLIADPDSGFADVFSQTMVTVHALATIKSLADFLRPRLTMPERSSRYLKEGLPNALAAYAEAFANSRPGGPGIGIPPIPLPRDFTNRTMPKRAVPSDQSLQTTPSKTTAANESSRPVKMTAIPWSQLATPNTSAVSGLLSNVRRSRRHETSALAPDAPAAATPPQNLLECADEAQISDSEDISDREAALSAIVDGLTNSMDAEQEGEDDPSAVNLEVAATGKITARKEDGTRVATPISGQKAVKADTASKSSNSVSKLPQQFSTASRTLSYAAAIASTPQDWHLEFSVNGQPINQDTTIYRVVHFNQQNSNDISARNLLSSTHTIHFKKVAGPPPADTSSLALSTYVPRNVENGLPESLSRNPTTASILHLLSLLHSLNANLGDVLAESKDAPKIVAEPLSQFVNTKLTAKLNRQLEEPLIVASGCLPTWSEDLARLYPFLFPFETRHLFLQSTSFGFARSMTRWQTDQSANDSRNGRLRDDRHFLGRLQRQKVRISRARMLESAIKVLELYGSSASILEVEFFDEVGTGLGPTLEFYSTVSKEFAKKKLGLWRSVHENEQNEYAFGAHGLFPAPINEQMANSDNGKKVLSLFKSLGKFVARSMLDSRIIDVSFNTTFFRVNATAGAVALSLGAVESVDESLARSLRPLMKVAQRKSSIEEDANLSAKQKETMIEDITVDGMSVEDLSLDFTLPGYPEIELKDDGCQTAVNVHNLSEYIDLVMNYTLHEGVRRQVDAFQEGFSMVFPFAALQAFTPDELVMLFGRVDEDWALETLMDSVKADHGYNLDSDSVRNLLQIMSEYSAQERREFLQFVTGSPKLPIGGFKSLTPMFTVVCKPSEAPLTSDDYLPSVMTCVNYLKLPNYTTIDIMNHKLNTAIKDGQGAFLLS